MKHKKIVVPKILIPIISFDMGSWNQIYVVEFDVLAKIFSNFIKEHTLNKSIFIVK